MLSAIKGISVILYEKTESGVDAFNRPVVTFEPVTVDNVLVTPITHDSVQDNTSLNGKRLIYELCIPKGDTHEWEDTKVTIFGKDYLTIGASCEYIEDMVPLSWNKKISVAKYE